MSGVITGAEYITSGPNVGKISIAKTFDNKTITEIVNPSFYLLSGKSIKENPFFLKALSSRHAAKAQSAWTDFGKNFFRQRSATALIKAADNTTDQEQKSELRQQAAKIYIEDANRLTSTAKEKLKNINSAQTDSLECYVRYNEIADMCQKAIDMHKKAIAALGNNQGFAQQTADRIKSRITSLNIAVKTYRAHAERRYCQE